MDDRCQGSNYKGDGTKERAETLAVEVKGPREIPGGSSGLKSFPSCPTILPVCSSLPPGLT